MATADGHLNKSLLNMSNTIFSRPLPHAKNEIRKKEVIRKAAVKMTELASGEGLLSSFLLSVTEAKRTDEFPSVVSLDRSVVHSL